MVINLHRKALKTFSDNMAILIVMSLVLFLASHINDYLVLSFWKILLTLPFKYSDYISKILDVFITSLSNIVIFFLEIGIVHTLYNLNKGNTIKFVDIFRYYTKPKLWGKIALIYLAVQEIIILCKLFKVSSSSPFIVSFSIIKILLMIIAFVLNLYLFLANYIFIRDPNEKINTILKSSVNLMKGNIFKLILTMISLIFCLIATTYSYTATNIFSIDINYLIFRIILKVICYPILTLVMINFADYCIDGTNENEVDIEDKILEISMNINEKIHPDSKLLEGEEDWFDEFAAESLESTEEEPQNDNFMNGNELKEECFTFSEITTDFKNYDIQQLLLNLEIYRFLKNDLLIEKMFKKTYINAVKDIDGYDCINRKGVSANDIIIKKNRFRLILTITEETIKDQYLIEIEFYING